MNTRQTRGGREREIKVVDNNEGRSKEEGSEREGNMKRRGQI